MEPTPTTQPAPVPPVPPVPQPPRPGSGRFWLGVLAGGCGVLVLEALIFLIVTVVLGVALKSALRSPTGGVGPGLPGGVSLPSNVPGFSQSSDPCSPQPCMAHGGVTVLVGGVNRSAGASAGGSHLVAVTVTFADTSGTHTVTPAELGMRDPSGTLTLPDASAASPACAGASTTQQQDVGPGQKAGPYTVCYSVSGPASGPLTLVWVDPADLSLTELKLP
jgi:hypothetical protein